MMEVPWITWPAIGWLGKVCDPSMSVFEWGSGGSTRWFVGRGMRVTSVEHDLPWYYRTRRAVGDSRAEMIYAPPDDSAIEGYGSSDERYEGLNFKEYVECLRAPYDIVFIDGRARDACLRRAALYAKKWIVLDNSERERYAEAMKALSGWPRTDFEGTGPELGNQRWTTTVWGVTC